MCKYQVIINFSGMQNILLCLTIITSITNISNGARILAYVPSPLYSHEVPFKPLWKELSLRGHQVVVITSNPINDKQLTNLTEIDISFSRNLMDDILTEFINHEGNIFKLIPLWSSTLTVIADSQLGHSQVREIINNPKEHFDVVIIEHMHSIMYAFGKRFNCPIISVSSNEPINEVYRQLGNPTHPIIHPELRLDVNAKLTLLDRVSAVLVDAFLTIFGQWIVIPIMQQTLNKHFGKGYDLRELEESVSLLLVNSNPILHSIRPLIPTIVEIGDPSNRIKDKPLDIELKTILDNATNGFIYFSLGSNVGHKHIPDTILQSIIKAFEELPYIVLWKFEIDDLENKPKNIIISRWLSQQEVLSHPNLKVFITQGGRLSVDESINAGVPIVGMPFFSDQPRNIQRIVIQGAGLSVKYKKLDKDHFKNVILEVINNPQYKKRAMELSRLCRDQPMTGLQRAVWWTEYVIRHKGTKHLRSPMLDIPWYQYYLLDVLGTIIATMMITIYVTFVLFRFALKCIYCPILSCKKVKRE